jgi:heat shock protein HslJ
MKPRILFCAAVLFSAACSHQSASLQPPVQSFNESVTKVVGRTWVIEPPTTTHISLTYQDGHFVGSSGCNLYASTVAPRDNSGGVTITPTLTTRRACVPPVMDSERQFLNRLASVTSMHVTNHELYMTYERGPDHGTLEFAPEYMKFGLSY